MRFPTQTGLFALMLLGETSREFLAEAGQMIPTSENKRMAMTPLVEQGITSS